MTRSIILNLPIPPSVNGAWRNVPGKGRVKSAAYKAWVTSTAWQIRSQRIVGQPLNYPVAVSIKCERPTANSDIDNRIKPILDILKTAGIYLDDKQVMKVSCEWADVVGAVVEVSDVTP